MKRVSFLIVVSFVLLCSCNRKSPTPASSDEVTPKEISVSEYFAISSSLPVNIVYEQKDTSAYLKMNVSQSFMDKVVATVKDSVLHLTLKSGVSIDNVTEGSIIYTNSKSLKYLSLTGAGNFEMKGLLKTKKMDIRMVGAGNFNADNIQSESLALTISGVGNATLKGKTEAAAYNLTGVGNVAAYDFKTKNMRVFLSGSGNVEVNASNYLYVILSGTGNISYRPKPKKIESRVEGSGKLQQK